MTDATIDHFDVIRAELMAATTRSVRRQARRRHVARVTCVTLGALALLTGVAAAASERVANVVRAAPESLRDVIQGSDASEPLSDDGERLVQFMGDKVYGDEPVPPSIIGKVLLDEHVDGDRIQIVAMERTTHDATDDSPGRDQGTCYSVTLNAHTQSILCTDRFDPGLPVTLGTTIESSPDGGVTHATLTGMISDSVERIRITTSKGTDDAIVGDRAYYWASDLEPTRMEVLLNDGTALTKELPAHVPPT
ncbi:MAG: hypothetical protein JWO69_614 [Thermoleophilia bacterium]|nr:hypothetical protein [Thermoleophilia bacterium]